MGRSKAGSPWARGGIDCGLVLSRTMPKASKPFRPLRGPRPFGMVVAGGKASGSTFHTQYGSGAAASGWSAPIEPYLYCSSMCP